jgi:Ca2+/Na+ antiporter
MDVRSILFAVGLIVVVVLSIIFLPESPNKEMIGTLLTIVYIGVYLILVRKKTSKKEKQIRAKIDLLKSEGHDLALEQEVDFNEHDLKQLYRRKRLLTLSYWGGTLALSAILIATIQVISDIENKIFWQSIALIVTMSGLGWVFFQDIQKLGHHMRTGKKTIVRGIVTNKRIESDETDTHFLEIDSLSVYVEKKVYNKYEIGDGIEIHIFKPRQNMLLYETRIESMSLN